MNTKQLSDFNGFLNVVNELCRNGINESTEKWIIENLERNLPFFSHLVFEQEYEVIERVTVNGRILKSNKRITDLKQLKYPPANCVTKYGRCNLKNQSVFYGSTLMMTAMSEIQPRVGDLITKSIWRLKEKKTLKLCPIFHVQPTNGTVNPDSINLEQTFFRIVESKFPDGQREAVINLSKFIAHHFSKFVSQGNDKDYLISAYFSDKIMNEFEDGSIDGIVYPSVKSHLSFDNIAIKPDVFDANYQIEKVTESVITKDPSDGDRGYLMAALCESKNFDHQNEKIIWNTNINQPTEIFKMFKEQFDLDLD